MNWSESQNLNEKKKRRPPSPSCPQRIGGGNSKLNRANSISLMQGGEKRHTMDDGGILELHRGVKGWAMWTFGKAKIIGPKKEKAIVDRNIPRGDKNQIRDEEREDKKYKLQYSLGIRDGEILDYQKQWKEQF